MKDKKQNKTKLKDCSKLKETRETWKQTVTHYAILDFIKS
jgi:hypothetical protein